jgi:hypothetical protein
MDTLARLDANNQIIQSTVENLSDNITSLVTRILVELTRISKQLKSQSGILSTITRQNTTCDAHVQDVEGCLVVVKDAVAMFDARLMGICTTTEETMMDLRNNVNDVCAQVIPDLHRNLHRKIHDTAHILTMAVQTIDTTVREVLARLPSGPAPPAHGVWDAMTEWPAARSDDQPPAPSGATIQTIDTTVRKALAHLPSGPTPPAHGVRDAMME